MMRSFIISVLQHKKTSGASNRTWITFK